MKASRYLVLGVLMGALAPAPARAQARTSLSSLRVAYSTRKAIVRPQGELKAQIDEIDRAIADAARLGRTGEVRRLLAKGTTLLSGKPWTDALDFASSLVLRSERVVVDSGAPYAVRLEQTYTPAIELQHALAAHVTLKKQPAADAGSGAMPAPGEVVKDLGTRDGISRDLLDAPFAFDLDLRDVPDGMYQVVAEVKDGERSLGSADLTIAVRKGLDELAQRLEAESKRAPEATRADILFPVDRMRNVNRGRLTLATFEPDKAFAAAQALLTAAKGGKDPFAGRTGDMKRHYVLEAGTDTEVMPYRLYVPKSYTGARAFPLIVALHGLGRTEDRMFDGYDGKLVPLAEARGYIVAAPLGYRVDGGYGYGVGEPPSDPGTRRTLELSEQDVMQVLKRVQQQYKIDPDRVYLMGHSMGGIGTWRLAPKYPELWAAVAPISGSGSPATLERIRHVPEIVVHGDADPTVPVQGSRSMVAKMKELGIEHKYIEVPGGNHGDVVAPNFQAIFDFFDAHRRAPARSTGQ